MSADAVVYFNGWRCRVVYGAYCDTGATALTLIDIDDGETVARATVNAPEYSLPAGHVLIKDWSENHGVLAALVAARVIADTGETVPCGFAAANICRLLPRDVPH